MTLLIIFHIVAIVSNPNIVDTCHSLDRVVYSIEDYTKSELLLNIPKPDNVKTG